MLPFKQDEDFRKHNQDATAATSRELKEAIQDWERLEAEKQDVGRDQRDIFTLLKAKGYNTKAVRRIIAERKRDKAELQEEQEIIEQYKLLLE